ncbi:MAG: hypothetical protein NZ870_01310 [bacterium]|nr:hypothetical protein [bacterium]
MRFFLGVCGSIGIHKAVEFLRLLRKNKQDVYVGMTMDAKKFLSKVVFETFSNKEVYDDIFQSKNPLYHLEIAENVDAFIIMPATYNIIGKIFSGIADCPVSLVVAANPGKSVFIVPAMHDSMWENKILKRNVAELEKLGYSFIGPVKGELADFKIATGRMAEPLEVFEEIKKKLGF